jgi:hypothetical protein
VKEWGVLKVDRFLYKNKKQMPEIVVKYKVVSRFNAPRHKDTRAISARVISDWITKEEAKALCKLLNSTKGELP